MKDDRHTPDGTIFDFVQGSAPFNGVWFGESGPDGTIGMFWWRRPLRIEIESLQSELEQARREIGALRQSAQFIPDDDYEAKLRNQVYQQANEIAELKSQVHALQCMGYDEMKRELWEKACRAQQDIDMFSSTHLRPPLAEYKP